MSRSRIIAGKAVIIIEAKDAFDKSLARIRSKLHKFANATGAIGDTLFRTGFFGAIATGAGLRHFGKFDDLLLELQVSMNKLDPAARKLDKEMISLEETIRNLGKSTSFTTIEVAEAAVRLAKAGLGGTQIEKSLQAILDLGRGTSTDLETSANIFIRAISAFTKNGIEFNDALTESNKIVSQFVLATRAGVLDLTDLEAGLRYVQGTAGSLNISLAETLAVLTELSNKGLVGSIGGTSLNTALNNLAKKKDDIEKSLQIKFIITPEGDVNFLGTLDRIFNAIKNVGSIQRTQILGDIFNLRGTRAIQAASAVEKIDELRVKLAGATDQARRSAKIMDQGIGGSFRLMRSAVEDLNISLEKAAQGPVVIIAEIIKQLATDLNSLSNANPLAASLVVLSPGILLASGLGFIALSKALRLAAVSAGVLKSAYAPLANLLAKGLGSQILLASRLKKIQGAKYTPGALASIIGGGRQAGSSSASALRSQRRTVQQAKLERLLIKRAEEQRRYARMIAARGVVNPAPYFARAATTRRQASIAGMYSRMAYGARGAAVKDIGFSLMRSLKGVGTAFANLGRAALYAGKALRMFFSLGGLTTIIEVLILFGDRIPVVSDVLTRFANAFRGAFSEIGKIASYALGPIEQFKVAFEAFSKRRGDIGMEQLKKGFLSLVDIVGNQLFAAWNRFKEALGPVWDTVRQIASVLSSTFEFLRQIASINLGEFAARLGDAFGGLASLFGSGEGMSFVAIFQAVVKGLLSGIATLMTEINKAFFNIVTALDNFIFKLEQAFITGAQLIPGSSAFVDFAKVQADLNNRQQTARIRRSTAVDDLTANNSAFQKSLDKIFNATPSAPTSKKAADTANALSRGVSQRAFADAEAARKKLYETITPTTPGNVPPALRPSGTQVQQIQQAKQIGIAFAAALVGSAASTRGNILKFGEEIEKKQLDVMTDIRDDIRKIGNNDGVLTFD